MALIMGKAMRENAATNFICQEYTLVHQKPKRFLSVLRNAEHS